MLMRQDLLRAQRRLLEKEEEVLAVSRMPTSGMIQSIRQELGSVERKLASLGEGHVSNGDHSVSASIASPANHQSAASFSTPSRRRVAPRDAVTALTAVLPTQMVCEALGFLTPREVLFGCAACDKTLARVADCDELWRPFLTRAVGQARVKLSSVKLPSEATLLRRCAEVAGRTSRSPKAYFFLQLVRLPVLIAEAAASHHNRMMRRRRGAAAASNPAQGRHLLLQGQDSDEDDENEDEGGMGEGGQEGEVNNDGNAQQERSHIRWLYGVAGGSSNVSGRGELPPPICVLALDRRVYDVSPFLTDHPGGRSNLLRYHGRDASDVFDIYGHSEWAHAFMRRHLLVFDSVAFLGGAGLPLCATDRFLRDKNTRLFLGGGEYVGSRYCRQYALAAAASQAKAAWNVCLDFLFAGNAATATAAAAGAGSATQWSWATRSPSCRWRWRVCGRLWAATSAS
mmetsp:Transcript_30087/g.54606  ORF Transcript_30087/g.54606 Transcript_30087/m.54606 type:complete len:456 (+) Transcript_30087:153-1520(+)